MGLFSPKNLDQDQYLVAIISYDLAPILGEGSKDVSAIVEMLNQFCHEIKAEIEGTHPIRTVVDFSHSEVIWPVSTVPHLALDKMIRGICQVCLKLNNWLSAEGFENMSIGFGIASGLVIIGPNEAFGTTRTKAYACAKAGLEQHAIIISEEAATRINASWCRKALSFNLPTRGICGGSQQVLVVDIQKFLGMRQP